VWCIDKAVDAYTMKKDEDVLNQLVVNEDPHGAGTSNPATMSTAPIPTVLK
jgi:hypothetical protein